MPANFNGKFSQLKEIINVIKELSKINERINEVVVKPMTDDFADCHQFFGKDPAYDKYCSCWFIDQRWEGN